MNTPIQNFKEYFFNTVTISGNSDWFEQTIKFLNQLEQQEREFAETCFISGKTYGENEAISNAHGEEITAPDFETFYRQYEI